jgi:hypothetical protein
VVSAPVVVGEAERPVASNDEPIERARQAPPSPQCLALGANVISTIGSSWREALQLVHGVLERQPVAAVCGKSEVAKGDFASPRRVSFTCHRHFAPTPRPAPVKEHGRSWHGRYLSRRSHGTAASSAPDDLASSLSARPGQSLTNTRLK